ncbi:MAG TPA: hypothetical protein DD435_16230 [Cyanobacteria bacterium UBA8530]|nr:hypothetical protein [Cyanobacteria bacterium UBA8530]
MESNVATIEVERCLRLNERVALPLFGPKREAHPQQRTPWRIAPEPFPLSEEEEKFFLRLGDDLLAFYRASNKLYQESVKNRLPGWIAEYLDFGKPPEVIDYGRMNRFKNDLPSVIRPDVLPLGNGFAVSELDSVPGGIGFTAWLGKQYSREGFDVLGGANGMAENFIAMVSALNPNPGLAIVVSREADDYWDEMVFLGEELNSLGFPTRVARPEQIDFSEKGLSVDGKEISVLYRFFELFDLKNVPKSELFLYSAKKERVRITPPLKAFLEEKMLFALFHHPRLRSFWQSELGDSYDFLAKLLPPTWILDDREVPPHAVIPGIELGGRPLHHWLDLLDTKKRERDYVIKASGFSDIAWGSRSLAFGKDLSNEDWEESLKKSLASFPKNPFLLQEHRKPKRTKARYLDFSHLAIEEMEGRTRLCPYYFVQNGKAVLGGILATICPADKLAIHGMSDAIMAPCCRGQEDG